MRVTGVGFTLCGDICGMFKVLIACNEVVEKLCVWDERTGRGARRLYKNTVGRGLFDVLYLHISKYRYIKRSEIDISWTNERRCRQVWHLAPRVFGGAKA